MNTKPISYATRALVIYGSTFIAVAFLGLGVIGMILCAFWDLPMWVGWLVLFVSLMPAFYFPYLIVKRVTKRFQTAAKAPNASGPLTTPRSTFQPQQRRVVPPRNPQNLNDK